MPGAPTDLELLAVHGGDISLLANGKGVGHSLSGSFGGDNKVIALLLDLGNGLDVFSHLDDIFWQFWLKKKPKPHTFNILSLSGIRAKSGLVLFLTHGLEELLVVLLGVNLPCSVEVHVV